MRGVRRRAQLDGPPFEVRMPGRSGRCTPPVLRLLTVAAPGRAVPAISFPSPTLGGPWRRVVSEGRHRVAVQSGPSAEVGPWS